MSLKLHCPKLRRGKRKLRSSIMVTQKQIAQQLGVSPSLVSRVLSGKAEEIGANHKTVQLIQRTADKLGYVASAAALTLRGYSSKTLAVAVHDFNDPFFGAMTADIHTHAQIQDYTLVLSGFHKRTPTIHDLRPLLKYDPDALLILGSGPDIEQIWQQLSRDIPVVFLGGSYQGTAFSSVQVDAWHGMNLAVQHLKACGHKSVGWVSARLPVHALRKKAFLQACREQQCITKPEWHITLTPDASTVEQARYLQQINGANGPTAFAAATDIGAIRMLRLLADHGSCVPDDFSITGFDDIPTAAMMCPSLTTIRQPVDKMVQTALEVAFSKNKKTVQTLCAPELIIRESTKRKK